MGGDDLKMLAHKETNTSQQIYGGNQDLGMSSNNGFPNVSLQVENSTSRYTRNDTTASSGQNGETLCKKLIVCSVFLKIHT